MTALNDLDKIKYKLVIMEHGGPLKKNYFSRNQRLYLVKPVLATGQEWNDPNGTLDLTGMTLTNQSAGYN